MKHSVGKGRMAPILLMLCFWLCLVQDIASFSIQPRQGTAVLHHGGSEEMMMMMKKPKAQSGGTHSSRHYDIPDFDNRNNHDRNSIQHVTTIDTKRNHNMNQNRRRIISMIGSTIVAAAAIVVEEAEAIDDNKNDIHDKSDDGGTTNNNNNNNNSLTTQLFNPDGSLKDTNQIIAAQERTIQLIPTNAPQIVWVDGILSTSSSSSSSNRVSSNAVITPHSNSLLQYNVPMKWDNDYIDSTTKERACTRIYTYRIPYPNRSGAVSTMTSDSETNKRRIINYSSSNSANRRLQFSDILNALPNDDIIRQSLMSADVMGGNVRRSSGASGVTTATTATKTGTDRIYSDFDLAVAPTTCSGGENEDLRLGFCPYDRIFLISATTMDDVPVTLTSESTTGDLSNIRADDDDAKSSPSYLSILIVESTRSEWQRANADLRRVRGSFIAT